MIVFRGSRRDTLADLEAPPPEDTAEPPAKQGNGCVGCLVLVGLLLLMAFLAWLPGAVVAALDAWMSPDTLDPLVPFRGGHFGFGEAMLVRDGDTLATRLVVGAMFFIIGGLFVTLPIWGLARAFGEAAADRVAAVMVPLALLGAFGYTPLASMLQPRYPVRIDVEGQRFDLRARTVYGPIHGWSERPERSINFADIHHFAWRTAHGTFAGGSQDFAEVYAVVAGDPEPEAVLVGALTLNSGELDLLSYLEGSEARERRGLALASAAAAALTELTGVERPPSALHD